MSDLSKVAAPPRSLSSKKRRFYGSWIATAIALLALPYIFSSGGSLTTFSLIGTSIMFSLSYNILLGQTGMLSFGHAVYYGLGGFATIHGMNLIAGSKLPVPLPLVPLIGGITGLFFAAIFGWVPTRRSRTAFAMISLGVAELVASSSLILHSFFGGEAGISANRTKLLTVFDRNFGPQIQIYYLVAFWTLLAVVAMYALTRTPFGRMCNAVRDNPERVQFVGYDPHVIRFLAFCFAGFFAGIAGALTAINFEIANAAYLGAAQSGVVLMATYIGGVGFFIGPIIGAIFVTYLYLRAERNLHRGLAALFRPVFHRGCHVCAPRNQRASDDAPPAGPSWNPGYSLARLSGGACSDIDHDRRPHSGDRDRRATHAQCGRRSPCESLWRAFQCRQSVDLASRGGARHRGICRHAPDLEMGGKRLGRGTDRRTRKRILRMTSPAIELRGVLKSFGNTSVIRDVNLTVVKGERHALIGPNGAGKTTLFNLDQRIHETDSRQNSLKDEIISGLPPYQINRRGLSRSFQVSNVFPNMSVWENIRCALLWATGHRYAFWKNIDNLPEVRERTAQILQDINLVSRRDVPAGLLAYAEQRTLEIGITVAGGADVILLDEPTAGMSRAETERAVALIRRLTESRTLLIIEHDMSVVFGLADRISVLVYGQIVASGTPEEIRSNPKVKEAYLGEEAA